MNICAVIMAGGSGSRLWPLSRASHPKQFLPLHGEDTMLQSTVKRLSGLTIKSIISVCNEEHRFTVAEQMRRINAHGSIVLEPIGRNTAPALALAALVSQDDPLLLVLPADHVILNQDAFKEAVINAVPLAESGKLVTFGITPNEPHTGFGYIKRGNQNTGVFDIEKFVEKPSKEVAKKYFDSGEYYWNSGMFLIKASKYLSELKKFRPQIAEACELSVRELRTDFDFQRVDEHAFEKCPSDSIDYAVMENTTDGVVVPIDAGWSDVGSWASLWNISERDMDGNSIHGDVIVADSTNSYISTDGKLVTVLGIENMIVVATKDAVMVATKDSVEGVKTLVDILKATSRSEVELHREVYRPWGKYDSVDVGQRHQVKRITVSPGAKLSLQFHHHRSEHWVVVAGTATVTRGEEKFLLSVNESTFIPIGEVHSLENSGEIDLELIEVQVGSYLGEDDIVRIEDIYGR